MGNLLGVMTLKGKMGDKAIGIIQQHPGHSYRGLWRPSLLQVAAGILFATSLPSIKYSIECSIFLGVYVKKITSGFYLKKEAIKYT